MTNKHLLECEHLKEYWEEAAKDSCTTSEAELKRILLKAANVVTSVGWLSTLTKAVKQVYLATRNMLPVPWPQAVKPTESLEDR